jgi:hypothetical protein
VPQVSTEVGPSSREDLFRIHCGTYSVANQIAVEAWAPIAKGGVLGDPAIKANIDIFDYISSL